MKKHEKRRSTKKKKQAKTEMHRKEEAPVFAKCERGKKTFKTEKGNYAWCAILCCMCHFIALHCNT